MPLKVLSLKIIKVNAMAIILLILYHCKLLQEEYWFYVQHFSVVKIRVYSGCYSVGVKYPLGVEDGLKMAK